MRGTRSLLIAVLLMACGTVAAQPSFSVSSTSGGYGDTVMITVTYNGGGSTADALEGEIPYDTTNLTVDLTNCGGIGNILAPDIIVSCADLGPGTITFAGVSGSGGTAADGVIGTLAFTIANPTTPTVPPNLDLPLPIQNELFFDGGAPVAAGTSTDGMITVTSGPGPGVLNVQPPTLTPPTAAVNGPSTTGQITISNDGVAGDDTFTPSCSLGAVSGTAGVSISVPPFNSALAPGGSSMVTASCSGTAAGSAMATYTCTAAGPSVTNDNTVITCDTAAGAPIPNPAANSMVSLVVGPVVRGNAGTATQNFSELGNSGGTYDVNCNITDTGGGAFSFPGASMGTVPSGGSIGIMVAGQSTMMDPQPTGTMVCDYTDGMNALGSITVTLGITLIPEIVPTLSQWGLILMILALVGFGAFSARRRMNV